jgi:hypothetical protein
VRVGGVNGASLSAGAGGGHDVAIQQGVFKATNAAPGTSPFPPGPITGLAVTVENPAATFTSAFGPVPNNVGVGTPANPTTPSLCAGGCLGGTAALGGQAILDLSPFPVPIPLSLAGALGSVQTTLTGLPGTGPLVVQGQQWLTGKIRITGVTTQLISVSGMQGVHFTLQPPPSATVARLTTLGGTTGSNPTGVPMTTATVHLGGQNDLISTMDGGDVTLVAPLRIDTGAIGAGVIPGAAFMKLKFVPEPGTLLLLVSGAAGLLALGRRRQRHED